MPAAQAPSRSRSAGARRPARSGAASADVPPSTVGSIDVGKDTFCSGCIAGVFRERAGERVVLVRHAEDENAHVENGEDEDPPRAEHERRTERDERLAEIHGVTEHPVEAGGHERRARPRLGERRERLTERPPGRAIEGDANREETGAEGARRNGAAEERPLERGAEQHECQERMVPRREPQRLLGRRVRRLGQRGVARPHADDEERDENEVERAPAHWPSETSRASLPARAHARRRTCAPATMQTRPASSPPHTASAWGSTRLARNPARLPGSITISANGVTGAM